MNSKSRLALLTAAVVLMGGCNGWPEARPYVEARNHPEQYLTYMPSAAEEVPMFTAEHHRYMILPTSSELRTARTRQVGSASGASVFALEGDESPYANLFARDASGGWRSVAVID